MMLLSSALAGPVLRVLVTRIAIYLGVGAITYLGMSAITSTMLSHVASSLSGLSGFAVTFLEMTGLANAANLVISALVGRVALSVATGGGAIKQLAFNGSTGLSVFG
jgi:hypothetical protein